MKKLLVTIAGLIAFSVQATAQNAPQTQHIVPEKGLSILINPANGTCPGADDAALYQATECHSHLWSCWAQPVCGVFTSGKCYSDGSCLRKAMNNRDRPSWRPLLFQTTCAMSPIGT
jgi:hypothetical protein